MRVLLVILTIGLAVFNAQGQNVQGQTKPERTPEEVLEAARGGQSKQLLAELSKSEYRAKMDVPAVDCLFVQDGKLAEGTYRRALENNPKAISAGTVVKISSVKVMTHGMQIFFASDSCALIAVSSDPVRPETMTTLQLLEMARKTIASVFETVKKKEGQANEKSETKQDPKAKS